MATITPTATGVNDGLVVTWETVTSADTATAWELKGGENRVFLHIFGDHGTDAVCTIQVSNDNTNWVGAKDYGANAVVSAQADIGFDVVTNARYIRPVVTAGTDEDLDITMAIEG